jgi:4a-hydroxytetrahydrobiopterin dehydratase
MSTNTARPTPRFSAGSNEELLSEKLTELLPPNGPWMLTSSGEGLQRLVQFKTFNKAWSFMEAVADDSKENKHHPEWANTYNTVFIRWTTHSPKGLSAKDLHLANLVDDHAARFEELRVDGGSSTKTDVAHGGLVDLADEIGKSAPDCCVPKKSGGPTKVQSSVS